MNAKQRKTLTDIFDTPTRATLKWSDLESLLGAVGAERRLGRVSRLKYSKGPVKLIIHRPHPGHELKPYQVEAVREFLEAIGVKP